MAEITTKPCPIVGCEEAIVLGSRGRPPRLCKVHAREALLNSKREYRERKTVSELCGEPECARPMIARKMCKMHYRRWERANGKASPPSDAWSARRKANWKKRHAIVRGADRDRAETIYPESIYERDNWTCQLCGNPVDRTLAFPHRMSASLDHRRPIAQGGTHTRDNVQLSHFWCNTRKGVKQKHLGLEATASASRRAPGECPPGSSPEYLRD